MMPFDDDDDDGSDDDDDEHKWQFSISCLVYSLLVLLPM
jgi:hypothetical protein